MSDLLNQASLVYIPSGYKEDVVYSVKPTDGSGDLTFTRASDGTRVNSQGLVERVPWNLCTYSEDQTQWGAQNDTTVTANSTTAPNGTTTADTVTPSTANSDHYRGIILGQQVGALTAFIYVKPNGYNFFDWGIWNGSQYIVRATFDLVNLTYTFTNSGTATIESVGDGWLKCGISGTNASLTTMSLYYRSRPTGGTGAFAGNGTSGAFVWGAQLNEGSTAKPYFPTTDRLNVPRLDYSGGCPSLLLEPQRTNLAYQSTITSFGSGANDWLNAAGTPASINQTTGIDGTQNGTKYTRTAGQTTDDFFYKNQVPVTSGTTYTVSGYIKLGTASNAVIVINDATNWNTIANGSIVCSTSNGFSTTAWKRFELTITAPASNKINIHYGYHEETGVTAQATGTFFFDGFQVEAGSYATSLIPTTSASVTRVADAAYKTGISSLIGQTSGSVFFDFTVASVTQSGDPVLWYMKDGGAGERYVELYTNGNLVYAEIDGSGPIAIITKSGLTIGRHKCAIAYSTNDFVFYVDGVQIGTDTSGTPNGFSTFGLQYYLSVYTGQQQVNQCAIFKTRLTNAELAALTTL